MASGTTTAGNEKAKQTGIIKRIIKRIDDWLTQRVRKPIDKWLTEEARKISDETPLSDPTKAFGELKEDKYKAELQLVDRYQSFVAELLRLSLAGIAVFGFLYEYLISSNSPSVDKGRSSVRKKHNS